MQTLQLQTQKERLTNSQRIMRLMDWNELEYATHIHETGLAYLRIYIPSDPVGRDALERSKIFWQWWKNHWFIRDAQFLDEVDNKRVVPRALYPFHHKPSMLAEAIWPNAVVLEESYANMIDHFNKSIV